MLLVPTISRKLVAATCLLMMSGMVDTIDNGMVPEVPSKLGLTFPASGSRGRQVNTSAYIYKPNQHHTVSQAFASW